MILRQPLPFECRDTVTGNAFFNGCVDELTWYLEDKSIWAAAMAMSLALIHVSDYKRILNNKLLLTTFFYSGGQYCFGNCSYSSITS